MGTLGNMDIQSFSFAKLPTNVDELKSLPEVAMDSPYKSVALAMAALLNFEKDVDAMFAMLDYLAGPEPLSTYMRGFIKERLSGKAYKVKSFFEGTSPENGYIPSSPLTIKVGANPNSFVEENYATMYVASSGADSPRPVKLRKKPSTGQWFVIDIQCLSDIRIPVEADPWA